MYQALAGGELSIVFLVDENPNVASAGSGGVVVGGARSVPDRAARSNSERAVPSACVGKRFSRGREQSLHAGFILLRRIPRSLLRG